MSEFHSATMTRVRRCDRGNRGGGGLVRGLYKGDKGKGAAVALYPIITLAAPYSGGFHSQMLVEPGSLSTRLD